MKRTHAAILFGQILSYGMIVTFLFADAAFNLSAVLRVGNNWLTADMALSFACLVALVGTINVWLTWYYIRKSNTMRDWLVICAWTHRVKQGDRWVSLEEFLTRRLGCQITHGISDPRLAQMRDQLDTSWESLRLNNRGNGHQSMPAPAPKPSDAD